MYKNGALFIKFLFLFCFSHSSAMVSPPPGRPCLCSVKRSPCCISSAGCSVVSKAFWTSSGYACWATDSVYSSEHDSCSWWLGFMWVWFIFSEVASESETALLLSVDNPLLPMVMNHPRWIIPYRWFWSSIESSVQSRMVCCFSGSTHTHFPEQPRGNCPMQLLIKSCNSHTQYPAQFFFATSISLSKA